VEPFDLEPDYRIPYDLNEDYWFYERCTRLAVKEYETLLIGDSVIWGQYALREATLGHYLNQEFDRERCVNLGLNGAHPVALYGLLEHYGASIRGKQVLLHFNPLWLSSPTNDLQGDKDIPFNHPRLVPQFRPWLARYKEEISPRLGVLVEQRVPFSSWTRHLQLAYFDRESVPAWTLEHPTANPLRPLLQGLPPSDNRLRLGALPWTRNKLISKQTYDWVAPETSLQWEFFRRSVDLLRRRGNQVFVLVGPFNEHILARETNVHEYQSKIKAAVVAWLHDQGAAYLAPAPLPSDLYADASHPLGPGYAILAQQVTQQSRLWQIGP
jgi:hypothetical protein